LNVRSRMSLDGQWVFSTSDAQAEFASITVPSPWQADPRFRDHIGTGWYEREFDIPAGWLTKNRVIVLGFGAVDYRATVWMNEIRLGVHEGGYLPFEFDITKAVRPGTNTLTVRVDDPLEILAEIPHGKQSWYGLISGIWQSVWVESRPTHHIQRVKISTYDNHVEVNVFASSMMMDRFTAEVISPNGRTFAKVDSSTPHFSLYIEHPLLWSPDEPNLYMLKVSTAQDEVSDAFGFRTIETRDGKILLNGKPFYLRGALDQDYYPELIYTPPSQEYIEDEFRKAKEMGLNCLRIHIKVADPRYYAAADKIGLLIWTELPNHALLTETSKQHARETIAGMVERDGNHPSICIWTIINESWGINLTDPAQRAWLVDTYHWLKELDPTRLVVGNSACWGNFHVTTDIADYHIYYAMPDHHEQWREWVASYARRPWWLFAHEYAGYQTWREFARDPWHAQARSFAPEVEQKGDEPLLVSEFGNWGLPDLDKLYAGNNGAAPWWFDTGLEWGEGIVYPRGTEQRYQEYHLDRVFPSLSALTQASQRLQFEALKFEIEQMRRYDSIQGYVITEFTDLHWECNGLLDMYRNPKVHYSLLPQINADDVLIPRWERLAFSAGEPFTVNILCSHYSSAEIQNATLEWQLSDDEQLMILGQESVNPCAPFEVTDVGLLRFDIPQLENPTRAGLKLRLMSQGNLIALNEQEIYVLPVISVASKSNTRVFSSQFHNELEQLGYSLAKHLSAADVAITTTLDDSFRDFILGGGKVLFLAERDDALQTYVPGLGIHPRAGTPWQGDWASSFGWHCFSSLPTKNVVNFAFAGLTPEHIIYGFAPHEFSFDVYAGMFVGWLHRPIPTIARRRMGRGEVLVSTFRLANNLVANPMAMYLFRELLELFH
jgi:hypothetical protein